MYIYLCGKPFGGCVFVFGKQAKCLEGTKIALVGPWALVGQPCPYGAGPYRLPWALIGWALLGRPSWPCFYEPTWALMVWTRMGPALMAWGLMPPWPNFVLLPQTLASKQLISHPHI